MLPSVVKSYVFGLSAMYVLGLFVKEFCSSELRAWLQMLDSFIFLKIDVIVCL